MKAMDIEIIHVASGVQNRSACRVDGLSIFVSTQVITMTFKQKNKNIIANFRITPPSGMTKIRQLSAGKKKKISGDTIISGSLA